MMYLLLEFPKAVHKFLRLLPETCPLALYPPPQFLFFIIGVLMASTTAFITASDLGYIVGNVPAGAVMSCAISSLCYALFRAFLARDYE
jgi:hypothetical protein